MIIFQSELDLKVEDLLILLLSLRGQLLVVVEEAGGCRQDLELVDSPLVAEFLQDLVLVVQDGDRALMGNVVETHDTVGDALGLDQTDPTYLGRVVAMCAAAGLSVNAVDVYDT